MLSSARPSPHSMIRSHYIAPHLQFPRLNIGCISGSLRLKSCNGALIRQAIRWQPSFLNLYPIDIDLPMFNEDREVELPDSIKRFRNEISRCDALLIACPEHNHSMPAALKNAIDWASRTYGTSDPSPLSGKPYVVMGIGGGAGTQRAQQHLRQSLGSLKMRALPQREMFLQRWGKSGDRIDPQTGELPELEVKPVITELLSSFSALLPAASPLLNPAEIRAKL